ncbi:MAG: HEAT repeat domain-containing protein [Candidatus Hydrogenedentes bacterium]|nr:HEAT repeat domain-containing protein [Candidatus Hydrogenedentota bacterium]
MISNGFRIRLLSVLVACALAFSAAAADLEGLLKQLPGKDYAGTARVCEAIVAEGADAIAGLCARLVPLGKGDDNAVRYALSGMAKHVTRAGAANERETYVAGLVAGLAQQPEPECKAFILQQLQFAGTDTAVTAIAPLVNDAGVTNEAIMALTAIGTPVAADALKTAEAGAGDAVKANIGFALARMATSPAEVTASSVPESTEGVILPERFIEARDLAQAGKTRKAARICKELLQTHVPPVICIQILDLAVSIEGGKAQPVLMGLMNHHGAECRQAALTHAAKLLNKSSIKKWERIQKKAAPEVQAEIAAMLAGKR